MEDLMVTRNFECASEPIDLGDVSRKSFMNPGSDVRCVANLNTVGEMIYKGCEDANRCPDRLFQYVGFQ
jgi:hypothetical protein